MLLMVQKPAALGQVYSQVYNNEYVDPLRFTPYRIRLGMFVNAAGGLSHASVRRVSGIERMFACLFDRAPVRL